MVGGVGVGNVGGGAGFLCMCSYGVRERSVKGKYKIESRFPLGTDSQGKGGKYSLRTKRFTCLEAGTSNYKK